MASMGFHLSEAYAMRKLHRESMKKGRGKAGNEEEEAGKSDVVVVGHHEALEQEDGRRLAQLHNNKKIHPITANSSSVAYSGTTTTQ